MMKEKKSHLQKRKIKMKNLTLAVLLATVAILPSILFAQEEEVRYRLPNFITNHIQEYGSLSETYPKFLKNRGDFKKFKEKTGNGEGVKVGIVDTGLDYIHAQKGGELEVGVAVVKVRDFTNSRQRRSSPAWDDRAGHGTHVAGHIGARANGKGIEGLASDCKMYIAKGLGDKGYGTDVQLSNAIEWLISEKVDIINLSLGGGFSPRIEAAVKKAYDAGILIFAAMGNEGTQSDGHPGNSKYTFGITAVDYNKNIANFSSRSDKAVYSGYGVNVFSTFSGGRYAELSGTSMATPDQVGIAALILGYSRKINKPIQNMEDYHMFVKDHIEDLGRDGHDIEYGLGFIDIVSAIATKEAPTPNPEPVNPPAKPEPDPDYSDPFDPPKKDPVPAPVKPSPEKPQPSNPFDGYKKIGEIILDGRKIILIEEVK